MRLDVPNRGMGGARTSLGPEKPVHFCASSFFFKGGMIILMLTICYDTGPLKGIQAKADPS